VKFLQVLGNESMFFVRLNKWGVYFENPRSILSSNFWWKTFAKLF